ncbi:MAG: methyltransferase FkbM family [Flaviaesturariibacter sp.]|nr:methyltransferase FkbM family [Flaviaesturariibacter sp.]
MEGYELEVIKGLSRPVPFISLECLFPEFRDELEEIILLLRNIDDRILFNVSLHEKLLMENFVTMEILKEFLNHFKEPHFELIVQMVT